VAITSVRIESNIAAYRATRPGEIAVHGYTSKFFLRRPAVSLIVTDPGVPPYPDGADGRESCVGSVLLDLDSVRDLISALQTQVERLDGIGEAAS
jgi:hypothetical protein